MVVALLEKTPEISKDIGRNARELVSLKILENLFIQGAHANPVSPFHEIISLDPSDRCEDVLRRIMSKVFHTFIFKIYFIKIYLSSW